MTNFVNDQVELILRRQVGDRKVLQRNRPVVIGIRGGRFAAESGDKLVCVHVNHGPMRKGESEAVVEIFGKELKANLIYVDATDRFLSKLENVADPKKSARLSAESLSVSLRKKPASWTVSTSWDKVPSIPIL